MTVDVNHYRAFRELGMTAESAYASAKIFPVFTGLTPEQYVASFGLGLRPRRYYSEREWNTLRRQDCRYLRSIGD